MLVFYFFFTLISIEVLIYIFFIWLKKDFKWLIHLEDSHPNFDKYQIKKYNIDVLDKNLGWDNLKKKKVETIQSKKKIIYNFDKKGSRITRNKYKLSKIFLFGDSYAMSRYVNDDESLQYFFEKKTKTNILNYGVGNYGLDQVYLKIKQNSLKGCKKIIIIFVPETILRIQSYWKHFLEFGNIFGFKPKFELKKNRLILKNKHIKKLSLKSNCKKINFLKKKDYFYENKFKRYSFHFPYCLSYLRNFKENSAIFINLLIYKIKSERLYLNRAFNTIVLRNIIDSQHKYKDPNFYRLLSLILTDLNMFLLKKKIKPYFFVIPQYLDLSLYGKNSNSFHFFKHLSKSENIDLFDMTGVLASYENYRKFYINDNYGGHLNKIGNNLMAKEIIKIIKKKQSKK